MRKLPSAVSAALDYQAAPQQVFAWRKRLVAAAAIAALGALPAAFAATRVEVKLDGDIARECAIADSGDASLYMALDVGDITKPGRKDFSFTVNCNAPFGYHLEAQYGALTLKGAGTAPRGALARVPYDVAVHIPTDTGAIEDRCSGESIRAGAVRCAFSNSGNAIALRTAGRLTLAWAPEGVPMAGEYADRLTIMVGARQ